MYQYTGARNAYCNTFSTYTFWSDISILFVSTSKLNKFWHIDISWWHLLHLIPWWLLLHSWQESHEILVSTCFDTFVLVWLGPDALRMHDQTPRRTKTFTHFLNQSKRWLQSCQSAKPSSNHWSLSWKGNGKGNHFQTFIKTSRLTIRKPPHTAHSSQPLQWWLPINVSAYSWLWRFWLFQSPTPSPLLAKIRRPQSWVPGRCQPTCQLGRQTVCLCFLLSSYVYRTSTFQAAGIRRRPPPRAKRSIKSKSRLSPTTNPFSPNKQTTHTPLLSIAAFHMNTPSSLQVMTGHRMTLLPHQLRISVALDRWVPSVRLLDGSVVNTTTSKATDSFCTKTILMINMICMWTTPRILMPKENVKLINWEEDATSVYTLQATRNQSVMWWTTIDCNEMLIKMWVPVDFASWFLRATNLKVGANRDDFHAKKQAQANRPYGCIATLLLSDRNQRRWPKTIRRFQIGFLF